jgi:hypothetical protein
MYIKEIELNNFRIYKGVNRISLMPKDDKNIVIVSGQNGFAVGLVVVKEDKLNRYKIAC